MFNPKPTKPMVFESEKNAIAAIMMELVSGGYTLSEAKDWTKYLCDHSVVLMNDAYSLTPIALKAKHNNITLSQLIASVDEVMLDNNSNNKQ